MAENREDLTKRFAEVLETLSPARKKELYEHLKSISPEEREKTMQLFVDRYEALHPGGVTLEPVEEPERRPVRTRKKLKKSVVNAIRAFIAIVIIAVLALLAFFNKDKLMNLIPEASEPSASAVETRQAEETAPVETTEAAPTETPTPTPSPAPTNVPLADNAPDLTGLKVVIDPGHQAQTSEEMELCAEWLSIEKPRCTTGTTGVVTGVNEYDLTLQYALVLKDYLEQCGAEVILTRDTSDIDLSNQERAAIAVDNGADLFLRLHADAANDPVTSGVRVYVPDTGSYTYQSTAWGDELAGLIAEAEGFGYEDTRSTYLYTGLNYANTIPSFQICLGFLSNSDDEAVLTDEENTVAVAEAVSVFCADFIV
ncbi:MAG: N-acetylmuramoyl-L-alanine amidase [Clostridiales bacterium]|nr:N-acetylmuramoyl-L-alanine amidase [Clostridiales bacterium]